jgi:hypothetical protein
MTDDNVWTDEWDEAEDWSGGGGNAKRLPHAERLGATVYEIGPGNFVRITSTMPLRRCSWSLTAR